MFKSLIRRDYLSLDDLAQDVGVSQFDQKIVEVREALCIAVIDDEQFAPLQILQNNHYNITRFQDLDNITQIAPYNIILCDLKGVGMQLNPRLQGAHIIKEIKRNYPDKYVVAYTGGTENRLIQESLIIADLYVPKDTDIEDWCDLLDDAIRDQINPVATWRKLRHRVLEAGMSPIQLADLEDVYVRSYQNGPEATRSSLNNQIELLGIKGDAKSIINSLLASAIFTLLFG